MKYLLFLFLIAAIACSSGKYFSSNGEKLYYDKCSGCHRIHNKNEYDSEKWAKVLEEMKKKARLTTEEEKAILNFLVEK